MKTGAMKVKAKNKNRVKNSNWQFWAIIAVPLIYAIVFAYIPTVSYTHLTLPTNSRV